MNILCEDDACETSVEEDGDQSTSLQFRYFNLSMDGLDAPRITQLTSPNSQMLVPVDIDEDGRLDIIVQTESSGGQQELDVVYNNMVFDSFFIKAQMLS